MSHFCCKMCANTTYGLNWHDYLQLFCFWKLKAITTGALFSIFNVWVEVPSPSKKIKKFKIEDGNEKLQFKIMVWSFNAQETWYTKRFSELWIMTFRFSGTCGRAHWCSLCYETVKDAFLEKVELTMRKHHVKWR